MFTSASFITPYCRIGFKQFQSLSVGADYLCLLALCYFYVQANDKNARCAERKRMYARFSSSAVWVSFFALIIAWNISGEDFQYRNITGNVTRTYDNPDRDVRKQEGRIAHQAVYRPKIY